MSPVSATSYLCASFAIATARQAEAHRRWIKASGHSSGSLLPLIPAIQQLGKLDMLLRQVEDERFLGIEDEEPFNAADIQAKFSNLWVLNAYEVFRVLVDRRIGDKIDSRVRLRDDLSVVRVPLAKFEVERHIKVEGFGKKDRIPLHPKGALPDQEQWFDPQDPDRWAIAGFLISRRGSIAWEVFDRRNAGYTVFERRELADRALDLLIRSAPPSQPHDETRAE